MAGITAKLLSEFFHNLPGKLKVGELFFEVPLDYSNGYKTINLFARSVRRIEKPASPSLEDKPLPWFVYLQGGPGGACAPPQDTAWVSNVLDKGYQILLLDQRGTGLSSPITARTLALQGDAVKQAEYLRHFRADNIVRDCEAVRKTLTKDYPEDKKKWSALGQSYGGFCAVTYLSNFPEGLREVFTTGGLPPLVSNPDRVYEKTYQRLAERNVAYYKKFPEDTTRVKSILKHLAENEIKLPTGERLTTDRFQQLGIIFGMHGGLDVIHDLVLRATNDLQYFNFLTRPTLSAISSGGSFNDGVIYAILHEAIYCQGEASNWSADRLLAGKPHFNQDSEEVFFTGEMIYRNMFESYDELRQMKDAAEILASIEDWPALYDEEQLARNEVPVYSATYVDDMYVDFSLAQETAGKIKNCKQFITNTMYHNALRSKTDDVIGQLFALRDDSID